MNKFLITLACLPLASAWALDTQPLSGAEQLPIARMTENGKTYLVDRSEEHTSELQSR